MAAAKIQNTLGNYKVNTGKLELQFKKDNPMLNDLIYAGVSQILGIGRGPLESPSVTMPSSVMVKFLIDMGILIQEEIEAEALHS